jgi:sugar-specific transcriptional regulator TrmB
MPVEQEQQGKKEEEEDVEEQQQQQRRLASLEEFGLTPIQARVFLVLLGSDGLSTGEISRTTGIHRSDVYRAIRRLSQIGLVEIGVGNPSRYYAIDPSKAVRLLLDLRRDEVMELESKTDDLTEWLEGQRRRGYRTISNQDDQDLDYSEFKLVKGNAVIPKVIDSIQSAKSEIIKVVSASALRRHYIDFAEYEKNATSRGVTVRMLTEIQPSNYRVARSYSECVHLNHVANLENSLRYLIIDGSELVLAGTIISNDEPDRSVLSTRNSVLVRGCVSYFEELWAKSISFAERMKVLQRNITRDKEG